MKPYIGAVRSIPERLLRCDRWHGQDILVSVWWEKEALAGVFDPICRELGVGSFACKGYPSVSALFDWLQEAHRVCSQVERDERWYLGPERDATYNERHQGTAERCLVLYLGDHDPDGWEIPRSSERGLRQLMETQGLPVELEFRRIALNMDQIQQYNPPPFEAKVTSARYQRYIDEHATQDAWELDALEPTVLRDLVTEAVRAEFDQEAHDELQGELEVRRRDLRERMSDPAWMRGVWT